MDMEMRTVRLFLAYISLMVGSLFWHWSYALDSEFTLEVLKSIFGDISRKK